MLIELQALLDTFHTSGRTAQRRIATLWAFCAVAGTGQLPAQQAVAQRAHTIRGCVRDVAGRPISTARVSIDETLLATRVDADGCFAMVIPSGRWRLLARSLGYRSEVMAVHTDSLPIERLSFNLLEVPTALGRFVVNDGASTPHENVVMPEALRQQPALGERDVFRALPFLPGVSQPNDILGRSHLAGGASDEHGITLNGHPLQAPFHINSVFGAFNPAALDRVAVVMHHLTPDRFDRVSGSIDLETRRAESEGRRELQIGVLSMGGTISQPSVAGKTDVLVSARSSYLDGLLRSLGVGDGSGSDDVRVPSFRDALFTAKTRWSQKWETEALVFHTSDRWFDDGPAKAVSPRWGENLVGFSARYRSPSWRSEVRVSQNMATVDQRRPLGGGTFIESSAASATSELVDTDLIDLNQRWTSSAITTEYTRTRWAIGAGVGADLRNHRTQWAGNSAQDRLLQELPLVGSYDAQQTLLNAFTNVRRVLGYRSSTLSLGVRASSAGSGVWLAPRVNLSVPLSGSIVLSTSLDRRHQFDAIAAEPVEGTLTQPVFFLETPRSVNIAAVSAAWSPAGNVGTSRAHITSTVFAKQYRRSPVLPADLEPDRVVSGARPLPPLTPWSPPFARVNGYAVGATLGFDVALQRGWLLQGSYTLQQVRDERSGEMRPTAWDAPHQLSALIGVPVGKGWQLFAATQARSGPRITPTEMLVLVPTPEGFVRRPIPGALNTAQLSPFYRTDVGVQKSWSTSRAQWIASAQVINVFARDNRLREGNATGLPLIPSVSFEVRW